MGLNKLARDKRIQIIALLVEGMSLRATTRITGVSINTVTKLMVDAGKACDEYQDLAFRNLKCARVQFDEIWAFCYAKKKNVTGAKAAPEGAEDVWTSLYPPPETIRCIPYSHCKAYTLTSLYRVMTFVSAPKSN